MQTLPTFTIRDPRPDLRAMIDAANRLLLAYERSNGKQTSNSDHAMLQLCNAAIRVVDDGDFYRWREDLMADRGWNERGENVDEFGRVVGEVA